MAALKSAVVILYLCTMVWCEDRERRVVAVPRDKRADDTNPMQTVVDNLVQEVNTLKARVEAQQTKLDTYSKLVAFHAWSTASFVSTTAYGTIILPHLATNVGGGYDPQTGFFTAPVSGVYLFLAKFVDHELNDYAHAAIIVNGVQMASTISDTRHGYWDSPTISAIVHMAAGQRAQLRNNDNKADNFYGGVETTFSGVLIHAD